MLLVAVLCLSVFALTVPADAQITVPASKVVSYAIAAENSGFPVSFINADTTQIYPRNRTGKPIKDVVFTSYTVLDSLYRYNAEWQGRLVRRADYGFQVALTKIGQGIASKVVIDTLRMNWETKHFAFGDSVHIRLDSTATVGDEFEIKFRTVKPSQ